MTARCPHVLSEINTFVRNSYMPFDSSLCTVPYSISAGSSKDPSFLTLLYGKGHFFASKLRLVALRDNAGGKA